MIVTYVWAVILKGCVFPRARPDADAPTFHATFQNDFPGISYRLGVGEIAEALSADLLYPVNTETRIMGIMAGSGRSSD